MDMGIGMDFHEIGASAFAALCVWLIVDRLDKISKQLSVLIDIQDEVRKVFKNSEYGL